MKSVTAHAHAAAVHAHAATTTTVHSHPPATDVHPHAQSPAHTTHSHSAAAVKANPIDGRTERAPSYGSKWVAATYSTVKTRPSKTLPAKASIGTGPAIEAWPSKTPTVKTPAVKTAPIKAPP